MKWKKLLLLSKCKPMECYNFLGHSERKVSDSNGPYISTNQTKIINVSLSVILEFCLWSTSWPVHLETWKKYWNYRKLFETILTFPNLRLPTLFFGQVRNTVLCLKKMLLVTYIFTKLSQNVCLYILIYRNARCNCKLRYFILLYFLI